MIILSSRRMAAVLAPPLSPAERPLDLEHLSRMTLGEVTLEQELLQLFDRQIDMLMTRMRDAPSANVAAAAHTLKGSARGVGAWPVARAAERVECVASADGAELGEAVEALTESARAVRAAIAELLHAH